MANIQTATNKPKTQPQMVAPNHLDKVPVVIPKGIPSVITAHAAIAHSHNVKNFIEQNKIEQMIKQENNIRLREEMKKEEEKKQEKKNQEEKKIASQRSDEKETKALMEASK
jgi:hypothetical protein